MKILILSLLMTVGALAQTTMYATDSRFAGAAASIEVNNCITAVIQAGGGTCDATGIAGGLDPTTGKPLPVLMGPEVDTGNAYQVAHRIQVELRLPPTALWVWHLTDGTSCGIKQFSSTVIDGPDGGGGGERMILAAASGSNMDSLYCTDTAGTYVRAKGFAAVRGV